MKTFTLEDNEAQFVIQALGQMPTQSGAFLLFQKCADQFNAQNQLQNTPPSDPPQE